MQEQTKVENRHRKNLMEFYETLPDSWSPKQSFVTEAARACKVTECTVRNWIKGRSRPTDKSHYNYLSRVTGIPVDELFPRDNKGFFDK